MKSTTSWVQECAETQMTAKDIDIVTQMASAKVTMAVMNLSVNGLQLILRRRIGSAISIDMTI